MTKTSTLSTATLLILIIASQGATAASFNPFPMSGVPPVFSAGKAERACERDYNKCAGFVGSLCKRLLKRGLGGGSMKNCEERKLRRCAGKENTCLGKIN